MCDEIKYRKAVVTFIDLLGFSDLVSSTNMSPDDIFKILKKFRYDSKKYQSDGEDTNPRVFLFSDSIIRIRPSDGKENSEYPYGLFFYEILELLQIQAILADKGIFLRGGIAYGDIYYDEETVFGPALIKAYKLESKKAHSPRIIIDNELMDELPHNPLLRSEWNKKEDELMHIKQLITKRWNDKYFYIDYLFACEGEFDDIDYYSTFLLNIKEKIEKNLANAKNKKVHKKYEWLMSYYNWTIDRKFKRYARKKYKIKTPN